MLSVENNSKPSLSASLRHSRLFLPFSPRIKRKRDALGGGGSTVSVQVCGEQSRHIKLFFGTLFLHIWLPWLGLPALRAMLSVSLFCFPHSPPSLLSLAVRCFSQDWKKQKASPSICSFCFISAGDFLDCGAKPKLTGSAETISSQSASLPQWGTPLEWAFQVQVQP